MPTVINYNGIKALNTVSGQISWKGSQSFSYGQARTYYIAATAWSFSLSISGSGLWGYQYGYAYVDYWTGSQWSQVYGSESEGRGSSYGNSWSFQHNYNGGSTNDVHGKHLWRLRVYIGDNSGSGSGTLYWGSTAQCTESIYNSYFKTKPIKSIACNISTSSSYESGSSFDTAMGAGYLRGNKITEARAAYVAAYS